MDMRTIGAVVPVRQSSSFLAAFSLFLWLSAIQDCQAQLALPGAVSPTPAGAVATQSKKSDSGGDETRARPVVAKAPLDDAVIGKKLTRDGRGGEIEFSLSGAALKVARLTLIGDRLSRSGAQCRFDVAAASITLTRQHSATGLQRYQLAAPDCAFVFDILDGAILAVSNGKACEFKQSDCRADPEGLWGMSAAEFDPKKAEEMLGARANVEKTMRGNFRALYEQNKKDLDLRNALVREQAGFSSHREEVCRSYAKESEFGYCALQLTQAREILLGAQFGSAMKAKERTAAPLKR
jgi:hypothetical protein